MEIRATVARAVETEPRRHFKRSASRAIDGETEMLVFRTATRTGEVSLDPQVIVGLVELKSTGTTLYLSGGQTIGVDATATAIRVAMKSALAAPDEDVQVKSK